MALGLFPVVSDNIQRDTHGANARLYILSGRSSFLLPLSSPSQVRVLIRDCGDEQHVRRVGAALLSIAPGAHASSHILLHRQQVGKADGAYTLQVRGGRRDARRGWVLCVLAGWWCCLRAPSRDGLWREG